MLGVIQGLEDHSMALIQFVQMPNVCISKRMHAPKRHVTELSSWFKECRKLIPQIPDAYSPTSEWEIFHFDVTPKWIKWTIQKKNDPAARCHLVIDRQAPAIGL